MLLEASLPLPPPLFFLSTLVISLSGNIQKSIYLNVLLKMSRSDRFDGVLSSFVTGNKSDMVFLRKKMCQIRFLFSMEGERDFSHFYLCPNFRLIFTWYA